LYTFSEYIWGTIR